MAKIEYVTGDATRFLPPTLFCAIAHITNNKRAWGAGFTGALERAFPGVEADWRKREASQVSQLGEVRAHPKVYFRPHPEMPTATQGQRVAILHLCAQDGIGTDQRRVRYDALQVALAELSRVLQNYGPTIALVMPRIGAGLGGGDWDTIAGLIEEGLKDWDGNVYICTLPGN